LLQPVSGWQRPGRRRLAGRRPAWRQPVRSALGAQAGATGDRQAAPQASHRAGMCQSARRCGWSTGHGMSRMATGFQVP